MTTPSADLLSRIAAAKTAVLAQTALLHREFGRAPSEWKYDGTRVTAADIAISEAIFKELAAQFPDDDYCSEELTVTEKPVPLTKRFAWVLDPIDGTNNYAAGIAHCAISLALLEDGQPVYGVVYDHSRSTLIHGGPGFGAFDGVRACSVKDSPTDGSSILGFHSPYNRAFAHHAESIVANFKIRGLGSSTLHLAYVGTGMFDGVVDHNVKVWDIAAAYPICLGAGGVVHWMETSPFPLREFDLKMARLPFVAGNAATVAKVRELLGV